jgi:hypothetical protein
MLIYCQWSMCATLGLANILTGTVMWTCLLLDCLFLLFFHLFLTYDFHFLGQPPIWLLGAVHRSFRRVFDLDVVTQFLSQHP